MLVQSMISLKLTLTFVISLSNLVIKLIRNSGMTVMAESVLNTAKRSSKMPSSGLFIADFVRRIAVTRGTDPENIGSYHRLMKN